MANNLFIMSILTNPPLARRHLFIWVLLLLFTMTILARPSVVSLVPDPTLEQLAHYDHLPLAFVPNEGQSDPVVRFQARGMGGSLFFTEGGVTLNLPAGEEPAAGAPVTLRFEGANPAPALTGDRRLPGMVNYFMGNKPEQWQLNLPTYGSLIYQQLYDGIDLVYEGIDGSLKGTYYVAAGTSPAQIRWRYEGATGVQVDEAGNLVVVLPGGQNRSIIEQAPIAWQEHEGERIPVPVHYSLAGDGSIGFALPAGYDAALPLTIDPTLTYSTFLGGESDDEVRGVTVDGQGYIYLTGTTYSMDFPGLKGKQNETKDVFVTRLNPQGTAISWSTFIGGDETDEGHALALDGKGSLWLTGLTDSTDFPVSPGGGSFAGYYDIIVVKLNAATGVRQYSAMFGGDGLDAGNGLAAGSNGNIYITGEVSDEFNRSNVLAMALDGQNYKVHAFDWFGRKRGRDVGYAIALDTDNNLYITGETNISGQDTTFPVSNDAFQKQCGVGDVFGDCGQDAFITIINPEITNILYSTYLGGSYNGSEISSGGDVGTGIAVGKDGSVYVTGYTLATDFPVANAFQEVKRGADNFSDAFIVRLQPATNKLIFSTYFGGNEWDEGHALALDGQGKVYVAGLTNAKNFPTKQAAQPALGQGICNIGGSERYCYDGFAASLTANGALNWSTFLGGSFDDNAHAVALGASGSLLIAGGTESHSFPVSTNALQPAKGLSRDGFLVRLGGGSTPPPPDGHKVFLPILLR